MEVPKGYRDLLHWHQQFWKRVSLEHLTSTVTAKPRRKVRLLIQYTRRFPPIVHHLPGRANQLRYSPTISPDSVSQWRRPSHEQDQVVLHEGRVHSASFASKKLLHSNLRDIMAATPSNTIGQILRVGIIGCSEISQVVHIRI